MSLFAKISKKITSLSTIGTPGIPYGFRPPRVIGARSVGPNLSNSEVLGALPITRTVIMVSVAYDALSTNSAIMDKLWVF